jgi:hypothetical protein
MELEAGVHADDDQFGLDAKRPVVVARRLPPILSFDPFRGWLIRFSHSKIAADPDFPRAVEALDHLQQIVADHFEDIVVAPGSVLLVNNRSAIHGRRFVGGEIGGKSRWLMRSYANHPSTPGFVENPSVPHLLSP